MEKVNILELYKSNKTAMRDNINKYYGGRIVNVIEQINKSSIPNKYVYRTKIGYPMRRDGFYSVIERSFISKIYRGFSAEHAQKFYLYEYGTSHKKSINHLGYLITYELPFFKNRHSGAIDLVSYDIKKNRINLIEMKNCAMGSKDDSKESLIRAILEIETYSKFVNCITNYEKSVDEKLKDKLYETLYNTFTNLYPNLKVSKEDFYQAKFEKMLLIPESLYNKSICNDKEKSILSKIPKDIDIFYFKLHDAKNFDTKQKIKDCAHKDNLEINIYS